MARMSTQPAMVPVQQAGHTRGARSTAQAATGTPLLLARATAWHGGRDGARVLALQPFRPVARQLEQEQRRQVMPSGGVPAALEHGDGLLCLPCAHQRSRERLPGDDPAVASGLVLELHGAAGVQSEQPRRHRAGPGAPWPRQVPAASSSADASCGRSSGSGTTPGVRGNVIAPCPDLGAVSDELQSAWRGTYMRSSSWPRRTASARVTTPSLRYRLFV